MMKAPLLISPTETNEVKVMEAILTQRKRENGLSFYVPNSHQLKAHQSNSRFVLLCGGNRCGKSTLGAVELCMHLTRNYPDWFSLKRRFKGPIKAVVVGESNAFIEKVLEPKLRQFLPPKYIRHEKRVTGGYLSRIDCVDGSTVDFLTKEQSDMSFEGADWHFYWGDEPQSKRKFDAIQRGLVDHNGFGVITFTPLIEPWMKEELVDKADGKFIEVITASIRDNKFDIQGNAILSESSIKDLERTLSEDVAQTRIHGKFFHLRGTVYTEFSDVHIQRFQYNYPDPVICVLDPHDRQPHHVIWAILTPDNDIYIHTEIAVHCTVEELAKSIKRIEKGIYSEMTGPDGRPQEVKTGYNLRRRLIDPNFGRKPLITTGRNMIEELAREGCPGWKEADDPIEEGHLKVKDYLHYDFTQPFSHTNKPKLYFHRDRVPMTIKSMRNYQYSEWVGKTAEDRDPKEAPKEKDTHGADCIRYLCMSNPTYNNPRDNVYELSEAPY